MEYGRARVREHWGYPPGLSGKGGDMWFKGATIPRTDGWESQGVCWRCGKVGHKTNECPTAVRLNEVNGEKENEKSNEGFVEEDALEVHNAK